MPDQDRLHKTVIIDVVGLTRALISKSNTPFLYSYLVTPQFPAPTVCNINPAFPAVTLTAQTTYLTGTNHHGIVSNYLYDRCHAEFRNWHQSSKLIKAPRLYERVKLAHKNATTFSSFFSFPMGDRFIDFAISPKPQYLANNGILNDVWTKPESLRHELQSELGMFPLHRFWGPGVNIQSTKWIVDATILVDVAHNPTFSTIYLPHLDYSLQHTSTDPSHPEIRKALREIDEQVRRLVQHYSHHKDRPHVIILFVHLIFSIQLGARELSELINHFRSEYGIQPVNRTVHLNRILRSAGYLSVRKENGGELIDCNASIAFAVVDHQIAHVYINDLTILPSMQGSHLSSQYKDQVIQVQSVLQTVEGVKQVSLGDHLLDTYEGDSLTERGGDLVVVAENDTWFTYYYWEDESQIPDFAYTINMHRKPGYDPVEMYYAHPDKWLGFIYLAFKLFLVYVLRIRTIVDGTRFDCDRIQGSHGATDGLDAKYWPIFASKAPHLVNRGVASALKKDGDIKAMKRPAHVMAEQVAEIIWAHLTDTKKINM